MFILTKNKGDKLKLSKIISNEIKRINPSIKPYLPDRYANKYVSAVLSELKQSFLRPSNSNGEITFSKDTATRTCGQTTTRNEYLFDVLQKSPSTSLIQINFTGNLGKLSRVILNPIYKDLIMYELQGMPQQRLTDKEREILKKKANVTIEIDPISLASFIARTEQEIKIARSGRYYDQLVINLIRARELLLESHEVEGKRYLMEYWETASTGRQYGHFNSLQRMNKEVRHAALGVCHKYDFQAHSFAVMASIAMTIDPTLKIAQVEDYIRYRTQIRKRIALEVGVREDDIKTVFTCLGFGAKPINSPYTSIGRVVTGPAFTKLMNQTEFKFIIEDLKRINDTVADKFGNTGDFIGLLGKTYPCKQADKSGRLRKKNQSQMLAWIYQNAEAALTADFIRIVQAHTGLEPLMTVHDCVYYKQKVPLSTIIDAQVIMREDYQFVRIEHEGIYPIATDEHFNSHFNEDKQHEWEHGQRIQQEEHDACNYKSLVAEPALECKPTIVDQFKRLERIPDYTEYHYEFELPNHDK